MVNIRRLGFVEKLPQKSDEGGQEAPVPWIAVAVGVPAGVVAAIVLVLLAVIVFLVVCLRVKHVNLQETPSPRVSVRREEVELDDADADHLRTLDPRNAEALQATLQIGPKIDFDEITIIEKIGAGASAADGIFKIKLRGVVLAMKQFTIDSQAIGSSILDSMIKEIELMLALDDHPNVLMCYSVARKLPKIGVLMKFCANGDMQNYLLGYKASSGTPYPIAEKIQMISEVAEGMSYLHSKKVIHRDLKPPNVLIDTDKTAAVADFGLSRVSAAAEQSKTQAIGTKIYMAPEMSLGREYDEKVDIFSFGILAFVVLTDKYQPYPLFDDIVHLKVANDPAYRPPIDEIDPMMAEMAGITCSLLKDPIRRCWAHDMEDRPSFSEVTARLNQNSERMKNVCVYLRNEDEPDADPEDCMLAELTYDCLVSLVTEFETKKGRAGAEFEIFRVTEGEDDEEKNLEQVASDADMSQIV